MPAQHITLIGAGNMGTALVHGLIKAGFPAGAITAADSDPQRVKTLKQAYGIHAAASNSAAVARCDLLVLAVKPQQMQQVLLEMKSAILHTFPVILSIAAGIRIAFIKQQLSEQVPVIRCMPNTPALIQAGISALYAGNELKPEARLLAETVVNAVGESLWLDNENQMDAVTALSGSGPAYFFYIMESLIQAGMTLGLSEKQARQLCLQTSKGAAQLAMQSKQSLIELRQHVTSPGGTTEAAIQVLQQRQINTILTQALVAAHARSLELAKLFGDFA
jgi:pyrroline-5-carboxylate reductase